MAENCEAFPQEKAPDKAFCAAFFAARTYTVAAEETATGLVLGLVHSAPNNICPCGYIANVSYAVGTSCRGLHIGEKLVPDCLTQAKAHGFRVMHRCGGKQHACAASLRAAGLCAAGRVPCGFRLKDGRCEDPCPFCHVL